MARKGKEVLNALDAAKTQMYHFTAIVIAGMGFFTDAYDLFSISLVTKLLGRIYYHVDGSKKPGTLPPNVAAAVNGVAFCGTLAGQLFFGWLGDKLGRKKVYGITLMVMVLCSLGSGLSFGHSSNGVMATLCFFRFWLGFGIGGDYPLSATIMSEYANKKTRGAFIAAVFAMQGFGILAGGIVSLIVSSAFDHAFDAPTYEVDPVGSTVPQADYVWRIVLMFGAIPALLTYYWRMKMPETARYTAIVARNTKQAAADMSKLMGFIFMTVFMFALAIPYDHWKHRDNRIGFLIMYSLTMFFANFGPNATTFVVPAEIFPARLRSTCHGISAASGKAGAIVGAFGFLYAAQSTDPKKTDAGYPPGIGVRNSLLMLGGVNFLGIVFTLLVPESKGKSLEELSREDEEQIGGGGRGGDATEMMDVANSGRTVPV
ncbi:hypothetical protein F2Q70_00008282 [Brassica cretica]|uniref:Major facilitator superfamily (MFS) profile domain-containing protein n=1 Tax=Brassica cretica TaxID=69181 RepID=A0A8S9MES2_BRACR|nr:hypothetical protein F2Q70_00008282 [Brassica cretica]